MHKTSWSDVLLPFLPRLDQQSFEKDTALVLAQRGMATQTSHKGTETGGTEGSFNLCVSYMHAS